MFSVASAKLGPDVGQHVRLACIGAFAAAVAIALIVASNFLLSYFLIGWIAYLVRTTIIMSTSWPSTSCCSIFARVFLFPKSYSFSALRYSYRISFAICRNNSLLARGQVRRVHSSLIDVDVAFSFTSGFIPSLGTGNVLLCLVDVLSASSNKIE